MTATGLCMSTLLKVISPLSQQITVQQVRNKYVDARMIRDLKRRHAVRDNATMRVRLLSMKRNDVLPPEIREIASKDMSELPRISAPGQLTYRCVLTSRPRGNVHRWSLSRFIFRNLVDYNKLAGVQRAMW